MKPMAEIAETSPPRPDDHVLTLCHMLANRISKAFGATLEEDGVSVAEWRVLLTLANRGKACGQEITGRWAMDKMAVNRAIASLKARGLIEASKNATDRRVIDLNLTPDGRALYEKLLPAANDRYRKLVSGLERSEEAEMRRMMRKMIAHMDALAS